MKLTYTGKILTQILSVLLCAVVLIMLGCTIFCPYFTITEPYDRILNPNPMPDHYTLVDVMWLNTPVITTYFTAPKPGGLELDFHINDYVTNMVIGFLFALAAVVTSIWFARNEFKRYPSMTSGILMNLCAVLCGFFTTIGYLNNPMLADAYCNPAFSYIRWVILALGVVILVLGLVRFVVWLITSIKLALERKARLALL